MRHTDGLELWLYSVKGLDKHRARARAAHKKQMECDLERLEVLYKGLTNKKKYDTL